MQDVASGYIRKLKGTFLHKVMQVTALSLCIMLKLLLALLSVERSHLIF